MNWIKIEDGCEMPGDMQECLTSFGEDITHAEYSKRKNMFYRLTDTYYANGYMPKYYCIPTPPKN
jgi:hypothetical protein